MLEDADLVVAVGGADPVGLRRLVVGLAELAEAVPGARTSVVVNRVPGEGDAERRVVGVLRRLAGVEQVTCLPRDLGATDAALEAGRPLHQVSPEGAMRTALRTWAASLVTPPAARPSAPLRRLLHR